MLERLPFDVWHIIFQLACTDGGLTGCALALASQACRRISPPTRLYSVSLHSVRQVRNFLICLERICRHEGEDPPVQHLLLTFLPGACDAPTRVRETDWMQYPRSEHAMVMQLMGEYQAWHTEKTAWNRAFVTHVSTLFARVGRTLRTLTVVQSYEVRLPLVRYHLPALRELTLLGDDRLFVRVPRPGLLIPCEGDESDFDFYGVPLPDPDGPDGAPFPCLERLHFVYGWEKLHPWEQTLPCWAELAPAVTHLRISQGSAQVPQMVRDMLGLPALIPPQTPPSEGRNADGEDVDGGRDVAASAPRVPGYPSLRLVIVQLSRAPNWASSDTKGAVLAQKREMERIAAQCAEEVVSQAWVSVLDSRRYDEEYWLRRLPREWRSRMTGGGGCWTEDEYDEDERWGVALHGPLPKREGLLTLDLSSDAVREPPKAGKWWEVLCSLIKRKVR
ncbi:hypothetical protein C8Q77DRAFT_1157821 [Trametes polyzona]|nr:hypothetical protein C8Q77DRAFT_1157821 [Trametes polyzona]